VWVSIVSPFLFRIRNGWIGKQRIENINHTLEVGMDVSKILGELRQEREQLEEAIMSLERLARGRGKRRGRPPSWMVEAKKRGRPVGSKNRSSGQKTTSAVA
jgi:hypothetical protein